MTAEEQNELGLFIKGWLDNQLNDAKQGIINKDHCICENCTPELFKHIHPLLKSYMVMGLIDNPLKVFALCLRHGMIIGAKYAREWDRKKKDLEELEKLHKL